MNRTVLLGAIGAAVTVAALAINYAVTWREAAVDPVAIEPGDGAPAATGGDSGTAAQPAPDVAGAEPPAPEEASTAALEPDAVPKAPVASDGTAIAPEFDIVRINPSGDAVIGGRAAPGSLVTLYRDGRAVESITADERGEWVMLPGVGVLNGAREISLSAQLPGQPEMLSEQVVVIVMPDPSTDAGQAPLVMLVPRKEGGAGAQTPAPTAVAETAPADAPPPPPAAEAVAAPAPEPAPAEASASAEVVPAPAEPEVAAASEADPAAQSAPLPAAAGSEPGQSVVASDEAAEVAAAPVPAAPPVAMEAAAAESAAAAVLELPSLAELQEIGATGSASDAAAVPPEEAEAAPEQAVGGLVAEGLAADALAAIESPALGEGAAAESPVIAEAAPIVALSPVVEEAPQRTTGAGVDSAASEPLVVAAVAEQPPARIGVDDNSQRIMVSPPPAAEPPAGVRNVPDFEAEAIAAADVGLSREAGPGGDVAAVVPELDLADAARPEVTENITVTEIMIELKWSRPVVSANRPAGEVVDAGSRAAIPELMPIEIAALPVLTDAPGGPLWNETLPVPAAYPADPITVALPSLPIVPDLVAIDFAALPATEPPLPALAALPERGVAAPEGGSPVPETRPETLRVAALEAVALPGSWTLRQPALEALPLRTPDAAIPALGDIGGRDPLAVAAAPAGLDLLDTASYQSTNPAAAAVASSLDDIGYQSTNPTAQDVTTAASVSSLDSATYQSTGPTVGGGIDAGAGLVTSSDSVDALIAEAKSALDAATRAQQALDGEAVAAEASVVPAALPDAPSPASQLAALALPGDRPGETADLAAAAQPLPTPSEPVPPAGLDEPAARLETASAETEATDAEDGAEVGAAAAGAAVAAETAEAAIEPDAAPAADDAEAAAEPAPAAEAFEVVLATPETGAEIEVSEPGLDLGTFQRDDRLAIGRGAYKDLDAETLQGEGIRSGSVALQSVEYDERGEVIIGGTATPNAPLNVYVDNVHVGSAVAGAEGEWTVVPNQPLSEGLHYLRVDQVEEGGRVVARVESPFARVEPIAVTAGGARVVVQPGNSLWRIARRTLADGTRYTAIYEANKSQIADPDIIYPGQVFVLPTAQETSNN